MEISSTLQCNSGALSIDFLVSFSTWKCNWMHVCHAILYGVLRVKMFYLFNSTESLESTASAIRECCFCFLNKMYVYLAMLATVSHDCTKYLLLFCVTLCHCLVGQGSILTEKKLNVNFAKPVPYLWWKSCRSKKTPKEAIFEMVH